LEPGEGGVIARVSDRDLEQLRYLGGLGLYPGVTVVVLEKIPFEGGLWLGVGAATHLLGLPLAAAIRVIGDAPAT
jgi:DtxR family Mn-dependent transcriptional regulator